MDLKISGTLFNSSGGGQGGFYFGRGQKDGENQEEEEPEAPAPGAASQDQVRFSAEALGRDAEKLTTRIPSRLTLPPRPELEPVPAEEATEREWRRLEAELLGKLKVLDFAVTRFETAFASRFHAEVGEVSIPRFTPSEGTG
ncbi:MAG: hypothetical protein VKP62_13145 [Candidatus Sericytochromatia bacterium]|nr:hypothetical protein [Candidatus Sericytochromatia bacterium]